MTFKLEGHFCYGLNCFLGLDSSYLTRLNIKFKDLFWKRRKSSMPWCTWEAKTVKWVKAIFLWICTTHFLNKTHSNKHPNNKKLHLKSSQIKRSHQLKRCKNLCTATPSKSMSKWTSMKNRVTLNTTFRGLDLITLFSKE